MKKSLLLGAGFSYDFGMPLACELTHVFLEMFNEKNVQRLASIIAKNQPYGPNRPTNKKAIDHVFSLLIAYKKNEGKNYEEFLKSIKRMANSYDGISQSERDSYDYVCGIFYELIHAILCAYQNFSHEIIYKKNAKLFNQISNLFSDKESWIFTLNHDLYLEYLALDFKIPITYGGESKIIFPLSNIEMDKTIQFSSTNRKKMSMSNTRFFNGDYGVNLVKLHGGLSEYGYEDDTLVCNLDLDGKSSKKLSADFLLLEKMTFHDRNTVKAVKDKFVTNVKGEPDILTKSMLTGDGKYSETSKVKEGEEKLKIFDDVLRDTDELTVIGYGFGDEHINFRISNALLLNKNMTLRLVDPFIDGIPKCIKQFDYDSRIKIARCSAAQWINYCKSEKWDYEQMASLKEHEPLRIEVMEKVKKQFQS